MPLIDNNNSAPKKCWTKQELSKRAAAYMRMSTELQKYSPENQIAAIEKYAKEHGIEIVRTFADEGKSGLLVKGRDALQGMIAEVETKTADFGVILVLDLTRWGRFQDVDESAHYEFVCRRAGLSVQYVAEQFDNDGSPMSGIMKNMKRMMAGEYPRELSSKVFAGACRLVTYGFRQGGAAGYGLRRMMINERGEPKMELNRGDRKSLQTDRVILIPGPSDEIENVQWIYRAFVDDRLSESQIAVLLNQRGVKTDWDRPWTRGTVREILINEKYIGHNVYNRRSFKLKKQHVKNPPDQWVRKENAFAPIIETAYFYAAQHLILERCRRFTDEEMIGKLKELYAREGWLSGIIIDEQEGDFPPSSAYARRFGGLVGAYKLVGFDPGIDYSFQEVNKRLRILHPQQVEDVIRKIGEFGGSVHREVQHDLLIVNEELTVSVVLARCQRTEAGSLRWNIRLDTGLRPDITIAIRMNAENNAVLDYYLLPAIDVEDPSLRLAMDNHAALDAYRFDDLQPFFIATGRSALPEAV
jgi:DNA invertase Pin-like site-specific DNA recombinase